MTRREKKEQLRAERETRIADQFDFVMDPYEEESYEVYSKKSSLHWGQAIHITYCFPMNLFIPKGEFWFVPEKGLGLGSSMPAIGRSKEEALYNYLLSVEL